MDQNLIQAGQAAVAVLGGGVAVETLAENYLMAKVPAKLKPLVIPVVTVAGAAVAAPFLGVSEQAAILGALGIWATSVLKHDVAPSSDPGQLPSSQPPASK